MTPEAFTRLVLELKRIQFSNYICLHVNNEPFMHPRILSFFEQISEELPLAKPALTTNGALMRKESLVFLNSRKNPPHLLVNDYTPGHTVKRRLVSWLADLGNLRMKVEIVDRSWDERLNNSAGNVKNAEPPTRDWTGIICTWPFYGLFFTADLRAFLCCADYQHEVIVGDLKKQTLMEIWCGEPLTRIRESMLASQRKDIFLCSKCNARAWWLPDHCQ
jgi:hypothetical protein